jgi:hypothetical protein
MKFKKVNVKCFDSTCDGIGFHLFISIVCGDQSKSYVTYVCPHHQPKYDPGNPNSDFTWWGESMILRLFELIEQGTTYAKITLVLNSEFKTKFSGVQRSNGGGFRGDVSRKVYRIPRVEWSDFDTDSVLIARAQLAYSMNKQRSATQHTSKTVVKQKQLM